mmetsp:Transcript_5829/g.6571  ORF Transcript_5829/g.6571 Transcript_5829/m.6571 type:complete len:124 (+) Transcript_5829:442-813(+)
MVIAKEANNALKTNCSLLGSSYCEEKENLDVLFKVISQDITSKRQPFTKNSKLILKDLKTKMGEENLKKVARDALGNDDEVDKIMKVFLIKKNKDTSGGFRDFLKKKKGTKPKKDQTAEEVLV